jgi:hypothetical protein
MATTQERLIAQGVNPKYVGGIAARLDTLDPRVRSRFEGMVVQFYQQYGPAGYDLEVLPSGGRRTREEQEKERRTAPRAAIPDNSWHVAGAAMDFRVWRKGVFDDGTGGGLDRGSGAGNTYYGLLRDVALQHGLFNGVEDDAGHFQPVEFTLARRGQTISDGFRSPPTWTRSFRAPPLPSRDVVPPNESRVPISTPGFGRPPVAATQPPPTPRPRLRPARDPIGGLIDSPPRVDAPPAPVPARPPPRPNLRPRASLDQGQAAPTFDDRALDDRLAELRQISRETPHLFTRAMEAEHIRLIEAKMARKPMWGQ